MEENTMFTNYVDVKKMKPEAVKACGGCGGCCDGCGGCMYKNGGDLMRFNRSGNMKLGHLWSFSKLMGEDVYVLEFENGVKLTVQGSCAGCCESCGVWIIDEDGTKHRPPCYVAKSMRYKTVIASHAINTHNMRTNPEACFEDARGQLTRARNKPAAVRIDQSGELETLEELNGWAGLAEAFPFIPFYVYTKRLDMVGPWLLAREAAGTLPENLVVLVSVWHEYGLEWFARLRHLKNVKAFVYMDPNKPNGWGADEYERHGLHIQTTCAAYKPDSKGRMKLNHDITCEACKKCFLLADWCQVIGCLDH